VNYRLFLLSIFLCFFTSQANARKVRALFLGNSYTDYNNLPELVKQLALSAGDTLEYSKNTPGGQTFQGHTTNATSLNLIQAGNWDYVILQEQSQLPSFPDAQVANQVYPYARKLDSLVKAHNPCAQTMFYMTWGRKNGDAGNCANMPVLCTYEGMDSMLQLRYTIMADNNDASIAPVAKVWRKLRQDHASIDLYIGDESHPSNKGSFAAACTFYAMIFDKDPTAATYNFTLNASEAGIIKSVSKSVVFDSIAFWRRFDDLPEARFTKTLTGSSVAFANQSLNANQYSWDFGDGESSTLATPQYTYTAAGLYTVTLRARKNECNHTAIFSDTIRIGSGTDIKTTDNGTVKPYIYPNPAQREVILHSEQSLAAIRIFDMNGRMLLQPELKRNNNEYRIDISDLPRGLFLVQAISKDQQQFLLKISKQ